MISLEEALKNADSASNLQVRINLEDSNFADSGIKNELHVGSGEVEHKNDDDFLFDGLSLEEIEDDPKIIDTTAQKAKLKTPQELMEEKIAEAERKRIEKAEHDEKIRKALLENID